MKMQFNKLKGVLRDHWDYKTHIALKLISLLYHLMNLLPILEDYSFHMP